MTKSRKAKLFRRTSKNLPEQKIIGISCEGASELQYFKMLQRKYGKSLYRSNNDMVNSQPYTNVQEFIKPIFGRED